MNERAKATLKAPEAKTERAAYRLQQTEGVSSCASPFEQIIHLQRTFGNQAVQRLFESGGIQARLRIGQPNDIYEQEADRVADQVMRMPEPGIRPRPTCAFSQGATYGEEELVRRKTAAEAIRRSDAITGDSSEITPLAESAIRSMEGGGRPLSQAERAFFEPRFGHDFSQVRLHTSVAAEQSARDMNANAYTVGHNVVFGPGQFIPGEYEGRTLLAHELTHVMQQSSQSLTAASGGATLQRNPDQPWECATCPKYEKTFPFTSTSGARTRSDEKDPLYFNEYRPRPVTYSNILEWAAKAIWSDIAEKRRPMEMLNLLQRHDHVALNALWSHNLERKIKMILASHYFAGSDTARSRWAEYLLNNGTNVIEDLNQRAGDWLLRETENTMLSGAIPYGARLLIDPDEIKQFGKLEEGKLVLEIGLGQVLKSGDEWGRKRALKVSKNDYVYFEVIQHEGIYFSVSGVDLRKMKAGAGQIAGDVAKSTRVWAILMSCVGRFFKGFLTTLVAPAQLLVDAGAKAIDMISLYMAAEAKWKLGIDIPHTCISSTCRQYEKCLDDHAPEDCKVDLMRQAFKEAASLAIPIIPVGAQAARCLSGDCEACGEVSVVFLPTIMKEVTRYQKGGIPKGIEEPKPPLRPKPEPPVKIEKPSRPTPQPAEQPVMERVVQEVASQAGSEVKLGDGTHGVAAYGKGKKAGFQFCSDHCALVADKLEQIEKVLPDKSQIQRDVRFFKNRVRSLDKEVADGKLTKEQSDRAARDIAQGLREHSGTAVFDTLLQMSPEDIQANRALLRKQVSRALERGKEIMEEIAGDQDVTGVLEDPKARTRVTKKPSPGRQPRQFLRGNFAHRFAEFIFDRQRTQRTHGPPALPRPSEAEVVVALRDGTGDIIRADRIVRNADQGVLIEIKPTGVSADIGRAQMPGRIAALQREFPKTNGWVGRVIEYTRADVEAWLRAENIPEARIPEIMAELGF